MQEPRQTSNRIKLVLHVELAQLKARRLTIISSTETASYIYKSFNPQRLILLIDKDAGEVTVDGDVGG